MSDSDREQLGNLAFELYTQISKELKEKGLTEEILNAVNTLTKLLSVLYQF